MLFFLITNIIIREKVSILFYFCYIYTESKGVVTLLSKYNASICLVLLQADDERE